jgi:hypothetical protein
MICPNKNLPEWKALENTNPELALYYWNIHNGNPPNYLTDFKVLEDLFESNPELANAVYESLGFKTDKKGIIKLVHYSSKNTNPLDNFQENYPLYTSIGENSEYRDYGKKFNFLVKENANIKSLTDFHGKFGIDLDVHDRASKGMQPYHFNLQEIKDIRKKNVDILIDDWGEYIILNPNSVVEEGQQKQQALQQYSQYLDSIFPDSQVKDIVYHSRFTIDNIKNKDRWKNGFYSGTRDQADLMAEMAEDGSNDLMTTVALLINMQNPKVTDFVDRKVENYKNTNDGFIIEATQEDALQLIGDRDGYNPENFKKEYVVFEPEQIHILGNKQDIEGFRQYLSKDLSNPLNVDFEDCQ